MSFEISLTTCNLSHETEEVENIITGGLVEVPIAASVSDSERDALRELLAVSGASQADEHGCYFPKFSDGGTAEVIFTRLADDLPFESGKIVVDFLSKEVTRFVYALAKAGNLAIRPSSEEEEILVTSVENTQRETSCWPDATVVSSLDELHSHLLNAKKFQDWKNFTDPVAENFADPDPRMEVKKYGMLIFSLYMIGGLLTWFSVDVLHSNAEREIELEQRLARISVYKAGNPNDYYQPGPGYSIVIRMPHKTSKGEIEMRNEVEWIQTTNNILGISRLIGFVVLGIASIYFVLALLRMLRKKSVNAIS